VREQFVSMTSRTRGVDETCECEKVTSSAIYETKDNRVSIDQVMLAVIVQDCLRGDALVDFYSRESDTLVTYS